MSKPNFEAIDDLAELGNGLMDEADYAGAITKFSEALLLVPDPRRDWEAATWLYASIGDAFYQSGEHAKALDNFVEAYNCPGGLENPFVLLRLGQCYHHFNEEKNTLEYLLRAYMLEGENIFEEAPSYLRYLSSKVSL
ncbi:MAG: hypothetical protein J0I41_03960 [Filimonas sp.]|nr:hypothetical protein [Filimonas sp.]